jgi:hypothetical protein
MASDLKVFLARPKWLAVQAGILLICAVASVLWSLQREGLQAPLKVDSFTVVLHARPPYSAPEGLIGNNAFAGQFEDNDVRVEAHLNTPAYYYLIALNPNGEAQLCLPKGELAKPTRATEIHYPSNPEKGFALTDGVGLQAFVLVASRSPLPSFREWRRGLGDFWRREAKADGVWRFDGNSFEPAEPNRQRGVERPLADLPEPLKAACQALHSAPSVEAIHVLAFPVKPRPGSHDGAALGPGTSIPAGGYRPTGWIGTGPRIVPFWTTGGKQPTGFPLVREECLSTARSHNVVPDFLGVSRGH